MAPSGTKVRVALAVTGSIAAYKAPMIARALLAKGVRVTPILSRAARQFVGAETFSGLTREPVLGEMFSGGDRGGELHIDLANEVDGIVVAPATADVIARMASGRADDLIAALALSAKSPLFIAPAMHPRMWAHPATQRNVATLKADGRAHFIGPVDGEVASGERGLGRMAEPDAIALAVLEALGGARDLAGLKIVVTAGPTVEDLDPVRFISNRSTGKMGYAIARRAAARGAEVTLVSGPVNLATPEGVRRVDVRSALSMQAALDEVLAAEADAVVMTAAVGDYRPATVAEGKLKRAEEAWKLELVPNPDIIATIGARRGEARSPVLVAFAVETAGDEELVHLARGKLRKKKVDLVVGNHAGDSFGRDDNRASFVFEERAVTHGVLSKDELADRLLDEVRGLSAKAAAP